MTTQTAEHRRKRSVAMRGKNTSPKSLEHRAAISASRRVGKASPHWQTHYELKLSQLRLAENLFKAI